MSTSLEGKQPTQAGGDYFDTPPPRCGQRRRLGSRHFRRFALYWDQEVQDYDPNPTFVRRSRYKFYMRTQTPIQNQIRIQIYTFQRTIDAFN